MSDTDAQVPLPDLNATEAQSADDIGYNEDENASRDRRRPRGGLRRAGHGSAVLGRSKMDVGELLKLGPGTVLELDRRVGEAIDIYVNERLVARGEVVVVEDRLGVTMTEIIKADRLAFPDNTATPTQDRDRRHHAPSHRRRSQGPAHRPPPRSR